MENPFTDKDGVLRRPTVEAKQGSDCFKELVEGVDRIKAQIAQGEKLIGFVLIGQLDVPGEKDSVFRQVTSAGLDHAKIPGPVFFGRAAQIILSLYQEHKNAIDQVEELSANPVPLKEQN